MDKQYVSEKEYDVDNEPVFPVCGTCNAQKDAYLLLPPEKIRDILQTGGTPFDFSMEIARAELDHLAKLRIVYVKETENVDKCSYNGEGHCTATSPDDCEDRDGCESYINIKYIPLSDYMKQMEAKE